MKAAAASAVLLLLASPLPLLASASSAPSSTNDPCAALAASPTLALARRCLASFPFNPASHAATLASVQRTLPLYVFLDVAKNTPDKRYQHDYDIQAAVAAIAATSSYPNDMAWQEALYRAFLPLNDGHASYSPRCYRRIVYRQPYYPRAVIVDGETRIFVAGVSSKAPESERAYLGREILRINGRPARSVLWEYARHHVGNFKDAGTRFNRVLASMTWNESWGLTPGAFASRGHLPDPSEDVLEWTFRGADGTGEESVRRSWLVTLPKTPFASAAEYWSKFCAATPSTTVEEAGGGERDAPEELDRVLDEHHMQDGAQCMQWLEPEQEDLIRDEKVIMAAAPLVYGAGATPTPPQGSEPVVRAMRVGDTPAAVHEDHAPDGAGKLMPSHDDIRKPIASAPGLALYTLEHDPTVAVLMVTTFAFSKPQETWAWRTHLAEMLTRMRDLGTRRLMLELSGNGGGNACLAIELLSVLVKDANAPFPALAYGFNKDARASPLHKLLAERTIRAGRRSSSFHPGIYTDMRTGQPFRGMDLFEPPRARPLAVQMGVRDTTPYTHVLQDRCPPARGPGPNPLEAITWRVVENPARDMLVVSDGQCGSACGRVYYYLREVHRVPAAVTGHVPGLARSAAAFPAAQVFDAEQLQREIRELGLSGQPLVPGPFVVQARMRFAIRESFGFSDTTTPLEYVWTPADIKADVDAASSLRPDVAWARMASQRWAGQ